MFEWAAWIEDKLEAVKGKTPEATKARREATLRALLSGRESRRFADPAAIFGQKGTRGEL